MGKRYLINKAKNHCLGLCLNLFSTITADFNIPSALKRAIQDQWSSGYQLLPQIYISCGVKP